MPHPDFLDSFQTAFFTIIWTVLCVLSVFGWERECMSEEGFTDVHIAERYQKNEFEFA